MSTKMFDRRRKPHHGMVGIFQKTRSPLVDTTGDDLRSELHSMVSNTHFLLVIDTKIGYAKNVAVGAHRIPTAT